MILMLLSLFFFTPSSFVSLTTPTTTTHHRHNAQMLQVFESSAGELSPPMFEEFALPYLAQIPARVRAALREKSVTSSVTKHGVIDATAPDVDDTDIPITCFPRCTFCNA